MVLAFTVLVAACDGGDSSTESERPAATPSETTRESATNTPVSSDRADLECDEIIAQFSAYANLVRVTCDDTYLYVTSATGLPDVNPVLQEHRIMVDITAWIQRVPIPFSFEWKIPLQPVWLHSYEEASPRGPIAFAINGVPIFHYEARPDVSTDPSNYDPGHDTVVQSELDQCGGHAGQGDDYHYHYAPVCLLDEHDLSQPIGYGLDGVPLYYGTGGTDYYGSGLYNNIDNLPDGSLDECNALALDDGNFVYFTTVARPYTIGCHHASVDPALRIEPRPLAGRDQGSINPLGGAVGEPLTTRVTDFYLDDDGWWHLEYVSQSSSGVSATLFRAAASGEDCWDFEFRENAATSGPTAEYCR